MRGSWWKKMVMRFSARSVTESAPTNKEKQKTIELYIVRIFAGYHYEYSLSLREPPIGVMSSDYKVYEMTKEELQCRKAEILEKGLDFLAEVLWYEILEKEVIKAEEAFKLKNYNEYHKLENNLFKR